ncbi:MAG: VWA domain-containing protein, partial [Acidobacteriota bacterium]
DDRRTILTAIAQQPPPPDVENRIRFYAREQQNNLAFSLEGLRNLIDSVAGLPGRRAVLYISDGLPMRGSEDIFQAQATALDDPTYQMRAFDFDFSRQFQKLTARANTQDVMLFTVDAAGLRGYEVGSAQTGGAQSLVQANFAHRRNMQTSLEFMAEETGALAVIGTNNIGEGMRRFSGVLDNYYSLGYQPAHGRDGRYHEIEIEIVGRDDLRVRHRQGYRSQTVASELGEQTNAALLHGFEQNPHATYLELGDVRPAEDDDKVLRTIRVKVPSSSLTLLPRAQEVRAPLEVYVAAADEEGTAPVQRLEWMIAFPEEHLQAAEGIDFTYEVTLTLRRGRQKIAVGLHETITGVSSFVTRTVDTG